MRSRGVVAVVAVALGALGLSACGNVAEKVTEKATEKAIEAGSGGSTDVDINDDGSFSMKSKDGSFSMSADGELAEGFPKDIPLVDGKVQSSWTGKDGSSEAWWVTLEVDDVKSAYADAKSSLEDSGYTITGDYQGTADGQFSGNLAAEGTWNVSVIAADGEPGTVTYAVATPSG